MAIYKEYTGYHADKVYLGTVEEILMKGTKKDDRTGTGTISRIGTSARYDLSKGFPLLGNKELSFRIIFEELRWFLKGSTDLKDLLDVNVNIWNDDAYRWYKEQGGTIPTKEEFIEDVRINGFDLGPIYGKQLTDFEGVNQIEKVIESLRENKYSRRHIVSMWNPKDVEKSALPPCHVLIQFCVEDRKLSCVLYQRSNDVFLGKPFNIASYAILTHLIANELDLEVGEFIHKVGDDHIYLNHRKALEEQASRELRPMPTLRIKRKRGNLADYVFEDLELIGYNPHPKISGKLSVGLESEEADIKHVKIALCGEMRSGKDTVADYIENNFKGVGRYALGDSLKDEFHGLHPEVPRYPKPVRAYQLFGQLQREVEGEDVWLNKCKEKINRDVDAIEMWMRAFRGNYEMDTHVTMITDIRQQNEYDRLKEEGYFVVKLWAPTDQRESRRKGSKDILKGGEETFETENNILYFDEDYSLINNSTIEDLHQEVDSLMELLGVERDNEV